MSNNLLSSLKQHTIVVADTGDFESIRKYQPRDATTNPSLILKAAQMPEYAGVIDKALAEAKQGGTTGTALLGAAMDQIAVAFGLEILKIVPNRVSTEVDARLSFNTAATVNKARKLISLYNAAGIPNDRVLIKIASTWEGIRAAEILEREGINCNLTLLFGFAQARASAEARATLISPFVGRILDWHKAKSGHDFTAEADPGVQSVRKIYAYYKAYGFKTIIMGASFRNMGEILALAGCDRLTIAPPLLEELKATQGFLVRRLNDTGATESQPPSMTEAAFRWEMNEDAMATEKLTEGIRGFTVDQIKLEKTLAEKL